MIEAACYARSHIVAARSRLAAFALWHPAPAPLAQLGAVPRDARLPQARTGRRAGRASPSPRCASAVRERRSRRLRRGRGEAARLYRLQPGDRGARCGRAGRRHCSARPIRGRSTSRRSARATATRSTFRPPGRATSRVRRRTPRRGAVARRRPPAAVDVNRSTAAELAGAFPASAARSPRASSSCASARAGFASLDELLDVAGHDAISAGARALVSSATVRTPNRWPQRAKAHEVSQCSRRRSREGDASESHSDGARATARRRAARTRRRHAGRRRRASASSNASRTSRARFAMPGLSAGDRVALIAHDCVDWIVCDFATLFAGCVVVPIYPTQALDHTTYILEHSEAKLLFVDYVETLGAPARMRTRPCRAVVRFDSAAGDGLAAFEARGAEIRAAHPELPARVRSDARARRSRRADLYVGNDRSAERRHALARQPRLRRAGSLACGFEGIHAGQRRALGAAVFAHLRAHDRSTSICSRKCAYFICHDPSELLADLRDVRPIDMTAVPRIFDRVLAGVKGRRCTPAACRRSWFRGRSPSRGDTWRRRRSAARRRVRAGAAVRACEAARARQDSPRARSRPRAVSHAAAAPRCTSTPR